MENCSEMLRGAQGAERRQRQNIMLTSYTNNSTNPETHIILVINNGFPIFDSNIMF